MLRKSLWVLVAWQLAGCSDDKPQPPPSEDKDPATQAPGTPADASAPRADSGNSIPRAGSGGQPARPQDSGMRPPTRPDAAPSGDAGTPDSGMAAADAAAPSGSVNTCVGTMKLDPFLSDPKLCVYVYAQNLSRPRGIAFAPNGDLFVSAGEIEVLWDANKNGTSEASERATWGSASGLNHGIAFSRDNKWLYASSPTTVFRWAYKEGQREAEGSPQTVITGIPGGGHSTRTLAFDSQGRLIVSVGSAGNVDTQPGDLMNRSLIRRFTIPETLPGGGIPHTMGEVLATGMRNEAGIWVDPDDRIWGVENGRDNLNDDDLGGDIHNGNPGEELNLVDGKGPTFYGYPKCFSEFKIEGGKGKGQGAQWADESIAQAIRMTDATCSDPATVRPPVYSMPAHWAPLGIIRYTGNSLPMKGDLIIGAHGSWNAQPPTGRLVARARMQGDTVMALEPIVGEKTASGQLREGMWNARPVDVRQGPDEAVYVSDDMGNRILKIGYAP